MPTITNAPTKLALTSQLPDIAVTLAEGVKATLKVEVKAPTTAASFQAAYEETLLPTGGTVTLDGLQDLIAPYAEETIAATVRITATELDEAAKQLSQAQAEFTAIYADADPDISAADFLSTHFLTIFSGTRPTTPSRLEYLHLWTDDDTEEGPTATATYTDGTQQTFAPDILSQAAGHKLIDASPRQFTAQGKTLQAYTVQAGARQQHYMLQPDQDAAPILLFTNAFACQELIYCTGTHQVSPEYTRSSARIGGRLRNYRIEEQRTFKANTGPLTTEEASWADDLFRSREVYVCNVIPADDGSLPTIEPGKEVTITESKSERSSDDDALPTFTFSYQYAQRTQSVLQLRREGRIFDNTFDHTFN